MSDDAEHPPHAFWQSLEPPAAAASPPWRKRYPAILPDGRALHLPIRPLGEGGTGIASLILNQASFAVEDALAGFLADRLAPLAPDVLVGAPTLGLSLARAAAARLGHFRYVPLGTSRKFWYDDALSAPMSSITSPDAAKRLYVDPRMLPLLEGRRAVVVDDVVSTGRSMGAALDLLALTGAEILACGVAMRQTERWRAALGGRVPEIVGVFDTPLLRRDANGGWRPA